MTVSSVKYQRVSSHITILYSSANYVPITQMRFKRHYIFRPKTLGLHSSNLRFILLTFSLIFSLFISGSKMLADLEGRPLTLADAVDESDASDIVRISGGNCSSPLSVSLCMCVQSWVRCAPHPNPYLWIEYLYILPLLICPRLVNLILPPDSKR